MAATTHLLVLQDDFRHARAEAQNDHHRLGLTSRELEVLKWIGEGYSTKQIAALLGITFKTAACHRYRVMDKLGIHTAVGLARYAIRNDIIQA